MAVNVSIKTCAGCKLELPLSEFTIDHSRKDGLSVYCRGCNSIHGKKNREKNRENIRGYQKNYYLKNRESYLERSRGYQEKNREYYRARNRENDRKLRISALSHLRDPIECVQCLMDDLRILTIDHIHGGGHKERKKIKQRPFYRKILSMDAEDARKEYRVLCRNCNWLTHIEKLSGGK